MPKKDLLKNVGNNIATDVMKFAKTPEVQQTANNINPSINTTSLFSSNKKEAKTKRISLALPESLYNQFDQFVSNTGLSKNDFLNRLITAYLNGEIK